MVERIQSYYDKEYHNEYKKTALLEDYSLNARLNFFQSECIKKENAKVLDYGCGTGAILTGLKNIDKDGSYGVDISESAIEFAKSKFPDYNWKKISIDDVLPFNESFDVVISSEVIEHIFDVDGYLRELHRVLKPNGILGLSCPFHGFIKDFLILVSGQFEKHFHNPYDPHIRFYSLKSIKRVLTKNSFELVKKKSICPYFGLPFLSRMMAFKAKTIY